MTNRRTAWIACALLTACSDGPTAPAEPLPPLPRFDGITQFVDTVEYRGYEWVSRVHLPRGYQHDESARMPLFLAFHGSGEDAEQMQAGIGLDALGDQEGFASVYPYWTRPRKVTSAPVEPDVLDFVRFLVRDLAERYAIDPGRAVATGFSAGGMLAGRLACQADAAVVGIAPVGATLPNEAAEACAAASPRPLPVLYSLGENDNAVPPEGRADLLSLEESVAVFRGIGACATVPDTRYDPVDEAASPRIRTREYASCAAGVVREDLIAGAGHEWLVASGNPSGLDQTVILVRFLLGNLP